MATVKYFLEHVAPLGLGPDQSGGGNGGAGVANSKAIKNELEKGNKGAKKGLGATLGIKFGVASLLKQSQVFTGFVGTIFQLVGALVDVILAPFLPILIPGIQLIARMIPYVSKYAQAVYDFLSRTIFQWFKSLSIPDWIKDNVAKALSAILVGVVMLKLTGLWNVFKSVVDTFLRRPLWALMKKMFPQLDSFFQRFAGKTMSQIISGAGKAAIRAVMGGWWDTLLLKLMFFTDFIAAPFKHLWTAIQTGVKAEGDGFVAAIIRKLWTNGLKLNFVDPLLRRLTGIGDLIKAPFQSLWKAITGNVATAGDGIITRGIATLRGLPVIKTILDFPATIVRNINSFGKWFVNLPFIKTVLDLPAAMIRNINSFGKWFLELPFMQVIKQIPTHLSNLFDWIPGALNRMINKLPIVKTLATWLGKELAGKLGGLLKGAKGVFGAVRGKVAGAAGSLMETAAPKAAGMLGNLKPSMLLKAAQGFKAIPILGAIAELGFGGWATYKDFKKYGTKAALGRAALTLANTTTALFDPTGLASAAGSIGSNIAMDIAYKKLLDPKESYKRPTPDIWIEVSNPDGVSTFTKRQAQDNNDHVNASPGMPKDRTSMDGAV